MQYIHQLSNWPNFRWDEKQLTHLLANVRCKQGYLLGKMSSLGFDMKDKATLEMMTKNIIKSSEIEGEYLNLDQVRSSLAKRLGVDIAGSAPVDRHIEGMVEMMLDATNNYMAPLTKDRLCRWHTALFPTMHSGLNRIIVGDWRDSACGPMQIVSGPIGRETVHFEAVDAKGIDDEMEAFFDWFNTSKNVDPILKSAIAHFWFVTIHPFEDGNGRIARAIADMCLAQADNTTYRFYSMSSQIEHERKEYYSYLEKNQKADTNITTWLNWFIHCLDHSLDSALVEFDNIFHKSVVWETLQPYSVNERQRKVINKLFDHFEGKLTTKKYAKLAKCSHDTALRDIKQLVEYGVMEQSISSGRNAHFTVVDINLLREGLK